MSAFGRFADRYVVIPDLRGPRIRLGVAWSLVMLVAALMGAWFLACLLAATAAAAALQVAGRWHEARVAANQPLAAAGAVVVVLASAVNNVATGLAVVALGAVATVFPVSFHDAPRTDPRVGARLAWGSLAASLPVGLAGAAAVQVLRVDVVTFLFLAGAVCTYDAGNFLCNGGPRQRLVGPLSGMAGVAVVAASMFFARPTPFSGSEVVLVGAALAVACPLGQFLGSWLLPRARSTAPALRRLDAWLISAPLMVVAAWIAQP